MAVLILHTLPPSRAATGRAVDEFNLWAAAEGVADAIPGSVAVGVQGEAMEIMQAIAAHRPDVIFNLCEAPRGQPEFEAHVAALFEWTGVRFTGSGSETLALCRRKDLANAVLDAAGVPIPRKGKFPCIVKPAADDGSAGMDHASICNDEHELREATSRLATPVIVQEFLTGREFAVTVWGHRDPEYVSIGETRFLNGLRLITYAAKWDVNSADFADSPLDYDMDLDPALRNRIAVVAREAWRAVRARGYLRVDIRLNAADIPCVLDVNPNPELGPGVGARRAVEEAGWSWERFVRQQVEWT